MKELLDSYSKLIKEIHDYFGYVENWVVIPIEDTREFYWTLIQDERGGEVSFSGNKKVQKTEPVYRNQIYTQRFLQKWVYRGKDYTMICVDTQVDGNKFLQIFDNSKEVKNED